MPGLCAHAAHGVVSAAMGHAPGPDTRPVMPDANRTIRSALGVLTRRGYTRDESLKLMCSVLVECKITLGSAGIHEHGWIDDLLNNVCNRLRAPIPSTPGMEARPDDNPAGTADDG